MKEPITIGQRIVAAVIAHQLGMTSDRAMKLYVHGTEIHASGEEVGEALLRSAASGTPGSGPIHGLQIVWSKPESEEIYPPKDPA